MAKRRKHLKEVFTLQDFWKGNSFFHVVVKVLPDGIRIAKKTPFSAPGALGVRFARQGSGVDTSLMFSGRQRLVTAAS